ncbi:MAG TPA: hypothetical protein VIC26_02900 [Marinagarivorans sp.]
MLKDAIVAARFNRLTCVLATAFISLFFAACSEKEPSSEAEGAVVLSDASPVVNLTLSDRRAVMSSVISVIGDPDQFVKTPDMFNSPEATLRGLAVQRGGIAINAPAEQIPVEIRLHQSPPSSRTAKFESVIETTLDVDSLLRIGLRPSDMHAIKLTAGQYRIRISQGPEIKTEQDLKSLHFVLELWPSDQTGTKVLKQSRLRDSLGQPGMIDQGV